MVLPRTPAGPSPSPALAAAEQAIPLWLGGSLMVASAGLVILGLAWRRPAPIVVGHLSVAAGYTWIGVGLLAQRGTDLDLRGLAGLLAIGGGLWAVFRPQHLASRLAGVVVLLAGQWVLSVDLGADYRTGVGQLGAALIQVTLAAGTTVLVIRQRVRPEAQARARAAVLGDADG